jgi:hypothetical protein
MTPLRTAFQKELQDNIDYGELVFALLKRKAESHLEIISPSQDEQIVSLLRALVDMHNIQNKLGKERYRLSVLKA